MEERRRETIAELARAGRSAKQIINVTGYPKATVYRIASILKLAAMFPDVPTHPGQPASVILGYWLA